MPPKTADLDAVPAEQVLPLQDWLKLLNARGCDMRVAMTLAAKVYTSHNTKALLATLDAKQLSGLVGDKDQRKTVQAALRGIADPSPASGGRGKKRTRDADLMQPLPDSSDADAPPTLKFDLVLDPEVLIPLTVTTNRAPVKTAWAYTVALKMGFDNAEALSIAHVYVHLSSLKHALMLGNILNAHEAREAEEELRELPGEEKRRRTDERRNGRGRAGWREREREREREEQGKVCSSQPWVGIMRAKIPVIERADGTWRAIQKGVPVQPSQAYLYITKAFKDYTPHVMGALKLLADSWTAEELNRLGLHMYNGFKPEVEQWGQRGTLECAKILDEMNGSTPPPEPEVEPEDEKGSVEDTAENKPVELEQEAGEAIRDEAAKGDDDLEPVDGPIKADTTEMTLEEYEAMLDADPHDYDDLTNLEGGFLEATDIAAKGAA